MEIKTEKIVLFILEALRGPGWSSTKIKQAVSPP